MTNESLFLNSEQNSFSKKFKRIMTLERKTVPKLMKKEENFKFSRIYLKKQIIFSAKIKQANEPDFLKSQLGAHVLIVNIKNNEDIRIINTKYGGIYYLKDKLMFILLPRKEAITISQPGRVIKSLQKIEDKCSKNKSTRGKQNKVYFETNLCNYVNIGIGTCRGKKGIYKREIPNLEEKYMDILNKAFEHTKHVCENYIPKNILKGFSKSMKDIDMPSFNTVLNYTEIL